MDVYYKGEIAVTPALTESDAAVLRAVTNLERTDETKAFFAAVAASPEPDLPYHAGLLEISEDRSSLFPRRMRADTDFGSGSSWSSNTISLPAAMC
jgi:hypothetical protein